MICSRPHGSLEVRSKVNTPVFCPSGQRLPLTTCLSGESQDRNRRLAVLMGVRRGPGEAGEGWVWKVWGSLGTYGRNERRGWPGQSQAPHNDHCEHLQHWCTPDPMPILGRISPPRPKSNSRRSSRGGSPPSSKPASLLQSYLRPGAVTIRCRSNP